jgi:RNase adapter protein RapZ
MSTVAQTNKTANAMSAVSATTSNTLDIVLITGMSGSGKSVVLKALEDAAYYCVDNLPPALLEACVALQQSHGQQRLAIVMDVRSAAWLVDLPVILNSLRTQNLSIKLLFLDATTDTLVRRYSETRRKHPLSRSDPGEQHLALAGAIRLERELLGPLREQSQVIDTSTLRAAQLQTAVKELVLAPDSELTLVFQSFAFKRSLPVDADYVFDVRVLPNPYYEPGLQALTGRDKAVATFLQAQPETGVMFGHIRDFLTHWLPLLARNHRGYVTVAIGCTGGQHRSVYLVERLVEHFSTQWVTLKRHRELHDRI